MIGPETASRIAVNAFGLGMLAGIFAMLVVNVVAEFVGDMACRAVTAWLNRKKQGGSDA